MCSQAASRPKSTDSLTTVLQQAGHGQRLAVRRLVGRGHQTVENAVKQLAGRDQHRV